MLTGVEDRNILQFFGTRGVPEVDFFLLQTHFSTVFAVRGRIRVVCHQPRLLQLFMLLASCPFFSFPAFSSREKDIKVSICVLLCAVAGTCGKGSLLLSSVCRSTSNLPTCV